MKAIILICEEIRFDKTHTLINLLNHVTVDVFPLIYEIGVFVKLINISPTETTDLEIIVFDSDENIVGRTETIVVRNYRADDQISGVDINLNMQLLLLKKGLIRFNVYLNKCKVTELPLTIRLERND